jgi:hypothetical protein
MDTKKARLSTGHGQGMRLALDWLADLLDCVSQIGVEIRQLIQRQENAQDVVRISVVVVFVNADADEPFTVAVFQHLNFQRCMVYTDINMVASVNRPVIRHVNVDFRHC